MAPYEHRIAVSGGDIAVYEWGQPQANRPDLIFFHATGFHGRCWDEIIRLLDGFHGYAVDARGHGKSVKTPPPHSWQQHGEDMAQVARTLGLKEAVGIGHSLGGNALVRAAAAVPAAFKALVLVDPVILPKDWYVLETYSIEGHFVLNRRRKWTSPDEMFASFKGRGPFVNWQDAVLRDYCQHGLLPNGEGYVLACAPEVEAHIYASTVLSTGMDIYALIPRISCRVKVLRCAKTVDKVGFDLMASPTTPDLAALFQRGEDIALENNTHFIPMESPEIVAGHIRELAQTGDV